MSVPWLIAATIFFLAGFWGLIIPVIPDLPLIWGGVLLYALGTGFGEISLTTVLLLGLLSASTFLIDYLSTVLGAKRYGASKKGIAGAIVGGIVGLVLFPPFGFLIGAVVGTVFAEIYLAGRTSKEAIRASKGAVVGLLVGLLAKVIIAGVIIGVFLSAIL